MSHICAIAFSETIITDDRTYRQHQSALAYRDLNKGSRNISTCLTKSASISSCAGHHDPQEHEEFSKDLNSMQEILNGVGINDQRLPASTSKLLQGGDLREMREKRSSIFKVSVLRRQLLFNAVT